MIGRTRRRVVLPDRARCSAQLPPSCRQVHQVTPTPACCPTHPRRCDTPIGLIYSINPAMIVLLVPVVGAMTTGGCTGAGVGGCRGAGVGWVWGAGVGGCGGLAGLRSTARWLRSAPRARLGCCSVQTPAAVQHNMRLLLSPSCPTEPQSPSSSSHTHPQVHTTSPCKPTTRTIPTRRVFPR